MPHAITQTVPMECVNATGTLTTVDTVLGYDPADPYAVTVTFHTAALDVVWIFARELLARGLNTRPARATSTSGRALTPSAGQR